jgi:hypothetical protein
MKRPNEGTKSRAVLDLLLSQQPTTLDSMRKKLNLDEKQVRGAIDGLRRLGWNNIHNTALNEWTLKL